MANLKDISSSAINADDPQKQTESMVKQLNEWGREISNENITKIFKDDSGTQRVLLGKGADNFQGIKVSQEGSDVYTADDDELVMSSDFNTFKILQSGTATIASGSNVASGGIRDRNVTVNHGLGTIPVVIAFNYNPGYGIYEPWVKTDFLSMGVGAGSGINPGIIETFSMQIDTSDVTFLTSKYNGDGVSQPIYEYTVKYFILVETANQLV